MSFSMLFQYPFAVTLLKAPASINADLMTADEIHEKVQEGYDDIEKGNVRDATTVFQKFWKLHE